MRWSSSGTDPAPCLRRLVSRAYVWTDVRDALGIDLWPAAVGASEPLDCDEAAYAYIGHRILHGDVMYRDLTENKPPLGYWLYTLTVALGGYQRAGHPRDADPVRPGDDRARLVDRTAPGRARIGLSGRRAFRRPEHGPLPVWQRCQPRAFHQFLRGRFACALDSWMGPHRPLVSRRLGSLPGCRDAGQAGRHCPRRGFRRGPGLASLVARTPDGNGRSRRRWSTSLHSAWACVSILAVAAAILMASGAGAAADDDIFHYGRALATDTLPEPNAPPAIHPLDHGQCRSDGPASLAIWSDQLPRLVGNRKLAPLAGLDPGARLSAAWPRHNPRSGVWSRSGLSRPGPRWPSRVSTGRTTTSCRSPARPSPWRSAGPTRLRCWFARSRRAQAIQSATNIS